MRVSGSVRLFLMDGRLPESAGMREISVGDGGYIGYVECLAVKISHPFEVLEEGDSEFCRVLGEHFGDVEFHALWLRAQLLYSENGAQVAFNPVLRKTSVTNQTLVLEGCAVAFLLVSK